MGWSCTRTSGFSCRKFTVHDLGVLLNMEIVACRQVDTCYVASSLCIGVALALASAQAMLMNQRETKYESMTDSSADSSAQHM